MEWVDFFQYLAQGIITFFVIGLMVLVVAGIVVGIKNHEKEKEDQDKNGTV